MSRAAEYLWSEGGRPSDDVTGPLLAAKPAFVLHAFSAMAAFLLGVIQLARPRGTSSHRVIGWGGVLLMVVVATSSFWIQDLRQIEPFSFIHGPSIFALVALPLAVGHTRKHDVAAHGKSMIQIFVGAVLIAGAPAFLPGRAMHAVLFGG